jgi:hypothetical protein
MSKAIVLLLCVLISIATHIGVRKFYLAVITSALVSTIIPILWDYVRIGYIDAWWLIAGIFILLQALVISIITGLIVRKCRKRIKGKQHEHP